MKHTTLLLAAILCSLIVLGGCSRPASDTSADDPADTPIEQEAPKDEPQTALSPSAQPDAPEEPSKPDAEKKKEDPRRKRSRKMPPSPALRDAIGCLTAVSRSRSKTHSSPITTHWRRT